MAFVPANPPQPPSSDPGHAPASLTAGPLQDHAGAADEQAGAAAAPDEPELSALPPSKHKSRPSSKARIGKGKRVEVKVGSVLSGCVNQEVLQRLTDLSKNSMLQGTVVSGNNTKGWTLKFDTFTPPVTVKRSALNLVSEDDDAVAAGVFEDSDEEDEVQTLPNDELTVGPGKPARPLFPVMTASAIRVATECKVFHGKRDDDFVTWTIHADDDRPKVGDTPTAAQIRPEFSETLDLSMSLKDIFFDCIFPNVEGHGAKMNRFLSNPKSKWYKTAQQHNLVFTDELVRQAWLVTVAGATEVENGIEALFTGGPGTGRKPKADFGRYITKMEYMVFRSCAVFMWCGEEHWHQDTITWDAFAPFLTGLTTQRKKLFANIVVGLMDESMVGWRPKSTATGGLPNITSEPRKPISVGTMFRNVCCGVCSVTLFHQVSHPHPAHSPPRHLFTLFWHVLTQFCLVVGVWLDRDGPLTDEPTEVLRGGQLPTGRYQDWHFHVGVSAPGRSRARDSRGWTTRETSVHGGRLVVWLGADVCGALDPPAVQEHIHREAEHPILPEEASATANEGSPYGQSRQLGCHVDDHQRGQAHRGRVRLESEGDLLFHLYDRQHSAVSGTLTLSCPTCASTASSTRLGSPNSPRACGVGTGRVRCGLRGRFRQRWHFGHPATGVRHFPLHPTSHDRRAQPPATVLPLDRKIVANPGLLVAPCHGRAGDFRDRPHVRHAPQDASQVQWH